MRFVHSNEETVICLLMTQHVMPLSHINNNGNGKHVQWVFEFPSNRWQLNVTCRAFNDFMMLYQMLTGHA
jgi:hypothetical protein